MRVEKFASRKKTEILDLEKEIGVELVAYERPPDCDGTTMKWYVIFDNSDIKREGRFLMPVHGDGATVNDAIKDYCKMISGKTLVIDSVKASERREVYVPELKHEKFIVSDDGDIYTDEFDKRIAEKYYEALKEIAQNYFMDGYWVKRKEGK